MTHPSDLAMQRYSLEPRTINFVEDFVEGYGFLSFARKYKKTVIGYRTRWCKKCFQKGTL